ncbi:putative signaling protein [Actinoplanes sp. SE50]|uniref:putative bifunctional diguanylate cyclase/phosphodiesterase n=1 Tax=unclassified Actinoplanes TaxID=2626549 RepID=UPI00023EC49F|nr:MULTISPECIES: EAL domain-containing protein [unclassified Actinoplanes]AEV85267.1 putative signaling protein [Actinoplanes sp. SE50/110]ATO83662.1 putative signaling protein [Actinoplanes sp. SE50]SLM01070.1 signaling protein [Actinoplanes sp. SE50/110]
MNHWSTHQLTEFFAAVCAPQEEHSAIMVAVERAAEVLETEIGAVLRDGRVEVAWGASREQLQSLLDGDPRPAMLTVPGIGELHVSTVRFGAKPGGTLLLARAGDPLDPEERQLLQAMAQTLGLALTNIGLLTTERSLREDREREASERLTLIESLREARHDPLTGLPTRMLFLEMLAERLAGSVPASVLFIDLDRFKAVNDSLGHRAGDELLGLVAGRVRGCLRPTDTAARIGGDEFAVLLADCPADQAVPVAQRLIDAIKKPFTVAGQDVFIGASIGIAAGPGPAPGELLGNADVAMYRAKTEGPGKVVLFEPQMHAEALARLTLNGDLQRALTLGEFRLQYQPLIDLDSGEPVGVEALVRWQNPERGYVSPADFVPMAEETGLISDLGRWVLHTAGRQAAAWRRTRPHLGINVNVSGRQLTDPQFAADVERMLSDTRLPAEAVTLELTESVLMSDPKTAIACLRDLQDLGVDVSIDDFGTGYSSLSYLQRLPVDELKIDRAFISKQIPTTADMAVIRTIVELARTLRLRTVIEGIETEAQRTAMRMLGCDLGQGYHLCRPVHPEDLLGSITPAEAA